MWTVIRDRLPGIGELLRRARRHLPPKDATDVRIARAAVAAACADLDRVRELLDAVSRS
ncbi:MAG: hypothetical protein IT495_17110 [Gammaproteobacteria bacterium]|nr:hypothetical protein [Gammaproteobacteria bacterium]